MCQIEPPPPEWVTFEIKTTMKDKYGPNVTPKAGKPSDAQRDYLTNIRYHSAEAIESLRFGSNKYNLNKEQLELLNDISKGLNKNKIVGYKLVVVMDSNFSVGGNGKYPSFYYIEDLGK